MTGCTLAVDASGSTTLLCLIESGHVLTSMQLGLREQSRLLPQSMDKLCLQARRTWSDIDALTYIAGPGSFTGLRIAAANINGLNTKLQCPVLMYSSLAVSAIACNIDEPLWVIEDARSGEVFIGCYQQGTALQEDSCQPWDFVTNHLPDQYTGTKTWDDVLKGIPFLPAIMPREEAIAQLLQYGKAKETPYARPQYHQRSQAEKIHDIDI